MSEHFTVSQANELLKHQRDVVKHIRTQAAVVGSYSLLVARFMSDQSGSSPIEIVEIADYFAAFLFILSLFFSLSAGLMTPSWYFSINADQAKKFQEIERNYSREDLVFLKCELLYKQASENERKISNVNLKLSIAISLATLQLIFWIL